MSDAEQCGSSLASGLGALDLAGTLDRHQCDQLLTLAARCEDWGRSTNLTGHKTALGIVERLILDALALDRVLPGYETLADLGSGAGFPGLPLAIAHPTRRFVLVDSRTRRHHFQRAVVRELGLENVESVLGRLEAVAPVPCDVAVAQALAKPERAAVWLGRWVADGGSIAIPGTRANPPDPGVGFTGGHRRYEVPVTGVLRTVWVGCIDR